jgi:hypothetical protein
VAVDGANLFIADSYNFSIRKVSPDGAITSGRRWLRAFSGDGGPGQLGKTGF